MNDYATFSYDKITEKVYLTDGFLMLFEFYSQDFVVYTPALTVWIYINVSSTNSEQSKLCVNGPLYIDAWLLWEQAIGSNDP